MFKDYPYLRHLLTAFLIWGCLFFFDETGNPYLVFRQLIGMLALIPFIYGIWLYYKGIVKKYYQQMKKKTED